MGVLEEHDVSGSLVLAVTNILSGCSETCQLDASPVLTRAVERDDDGGMAEELVPCGEVFDVNQ